MRKICILLLHLYLALAAQHQRPTIKKWKSPSHKPGALSKRSVGYQPELGACKDGQETCSDACGDGFEECGAGSYAAVFCYKPDDGETCCDDEGTACDDGYYCASGGDGTVCCPDSLSLSECEDKLDVELSTISSPQSSNKKVPPTPEPDPPVRSSSSTTTTEHKRSSATEEGTTTITKSSTTTVIVTVPSPSSTLPLATSPSRPASPATPVFPLRSTSHLPTFSSSPVTIPSSVAPLPSQPSFTNATASPTDEAGTSVTPGPTLSTNDTSAKASIGVPVFIPAALSDQRCDLACDEEPGAEIEVYFTDTVTERVTVTLQDDSNGCERVTTLTPTFTLTAIETITLGCSGSRQKVATTRGSVDIPADITSQRADENTKAMVYHSAELSEDAITRDSDEVPAGIAAQPVDKNPQATAHSSDELPKHIATPNDHEAIENGYAVGLVFPSTMYDDYEETTPSTTLKSSDPGAIENGYAVGLVFPSTIYDDDEEYTPPSTLTPSTISRASADATPTFEAAETETVEAAAGTRHAPTAFACIAAFALMRVGAVM